jgi:hypothetical protein
MTAQEQQMIDGLVERIRATSVTDKDLAAEQHLQQGLAGYPDAVYVLAQTVLVQQYGLEQAKIQIQQLQTQLDAQRTAPQQPASGGSFLSHLFGSGAQQTPPAQPQTPPYQPVNNPTYAPPPAYAQPVYAPPGYAAQPVYAQPGFGMGGGGFLSGALQTAAGIAAGEMAFQGIESLFHGFGGGGYGGGFGGGGFGGGYGGGRPEEIVNNYYEDGDRHEEHHHEEHGRDDADFSGGHENRIHDADYIGSDSDMNTDSSDQNYDSGSDDSGSSGDDDMNSF